MENYFSVIRVEPLLSWGASIFDGKFRFWIR